MAIFEEEVLSFQNTTFHIGIIHTHMLGAFKPCVLKSNSPIWKNIMEMKTLFANIL